MLVVLSAESGGYFTKIELIFSPDNPYIFVNRSKISKKARKIMEIYFMIMNFMLEVPNRLDTFKKSIKKWSKREKVYPKQIAEITEENGFNISDKLLSVENMEINHKIIENAPILLEELLKAVEYLTYCITSVIKEVQTSPHSDRLVSRGIQAYSERISDPVSIIEKFWPII